MIHPRLKEFVSAMSLEGLAIPEAPSSPGGTENGSPDFSLEDLSDCWRMQGVSYRNRIHQVDVSKALLPSGTQDEHAHRRKEALIDGSFYAPDFPLLHGVIHALYYNREGPFKDQIEAAKTSLSSLVYSKWLMTLTRIRHAPSGQDLVIHNYGQDDTYESSSEFVGPDGLIDKQETHAGTALQALLGTQQSPQEINQVYRWFRGTDAYLLRLNSRPKSVNERVAGFEASAGRVSLGCGWVPQSSISALGVRRPARKK